MDIGAVRTDLAAIAAGLGFNALPHVPESVSKLPAVVVGAPRSIQYENRIALLTLPVTVAFNASVLEDAQKRLDKAFGTVDGTSLFNAYHQVAGNNWRAVRCVLAEAPKEANDGAARVLTQDLILEVYVTR